MTIFRRDELRRVDVTLADKPVEKFKIAPADEATAEAKAAYQAWLGEPWKPRDDD